MQDQNPEAKHEERLLTSDHCGEVEHKHWLPKNAETGHSQLSHIDICLYKLASWWKYVETGHLQLKQIAGHSL